MNHWFILIKYWNKNNLTLYAYSGWKLSWFMQFQWLFQRLQPPVKREAVKRNRNLSLYRLTGLKFSSYLKNMSDHTFSIISIFHLWKYSLTINIVLPPTEEGKVNERKALHSFEIPKKSREESIQNSHKERNIQAASLAVILFYGRMKTTYLEFFHKLELLFFDPL